LREREPGRWVREVTPSPESITVREHHSFVQLPPPGYKPRGYDPRASFYGISYLDYATPISEPLVKRFIARHRLEKKDPKAVSEPVQPIVYYLDRGAPEPIRSALLEGARWWNQAFEAAGYKNAFRVELMPEGADSMDLRYNVIQWVHRATRGWSYGAGVIDPRTGENHQGPRDARVVAGAAGFSDCGKSPGALRKRQTSLAEDAGDGAGAAAAAGGARGGAHAGTDAQLFREHGQPFFRDGLSAAVLEARGGRHAGRFRGLRDGNRGVGQGIHRVWLSGFCAGDERRSSAE